MHLALALAAGRHPRRRTDRDCSFILSSLISLGRCFQLVGARSGGRARRHEIQYTAAPSQFMSPCLFARLVGQDDVLRAARRPPHLHSRRLGVVARDASPHRRVLRPDRGTAQSSPSSPASPPSLPTNAAGRDKAPRRGVTAGEAQERRLRATGDAQGKGGDGERGEGRGGERGKDGMCEVAPHVRPIRLRGRPVLPRQDDGNGIIVTLPYYMILFLSASRPS